MAAGEVIIFCGVPGAGKTSFYVERLLRTHVRVSLDVLRTRHRERVLFETCLRIGQSVVIDNTNVTRATRARYIEPARRAGFAVTAYFFDVPAADALQRSQDRPAAARVPPAAVLGMYQRLQIPQPDEGFDTLLRVRVRPRAGFDVMPLWQLPKDADGY